MKADRLAEAWYSASRWPYVLAPVALAYRMLVGLRRLLYRRGVFRSPRLPLPVVVIGNIAVGGTGKTPLVLWLAERLAAAGHKPGVVCKSYAAQADSPGRVTTSDAPAVRGDEAVLLASRLSCPVWSGPDRVQTARALHAAHPEVNVLLCDDGLQHYALARDVEIVVIDAQRGFGNGLMLPAGPLREARSRLRSVDAIVLNGNDKVDTPASVPTFRMRLHGECWRSVNDARQTADATRFIGRRVVAIAGIGHPARFFEHLRKQGIDVAPHAFPDHHRYIEAEIASLEADYVLMTEKDAIKCARFPDTRMWTLPVSAEIEHELLGVILARIASCREPVYRPI